MAFISVLMKKCTCERCNHKWVTRNIQKPKVCPKCKSPYWDTPKKKD